MASRRTSISGERALSLTSLPRVRSLLFVLLQGLHISFQVGRTSHGTSVLADRPTGCPCPGRRLIGQGGSDRSRRHRRDRGWTGGGRYRGICGSRLTIVQKADPDGPFLYRDLLVLLAVPV